MAALKGETPELDERYLPALQLKREFEEKRDRRKKSLAFAPPPLPVRPQPSAEGGGGGGGFFLTESGSLPTLTGRPAWGGGGGRGRYRASDAAFDAISDVAMGQDDLDGKLGALNQRMARLQGTLGPAQLAAQKRARLRARGMVADEATAARIAEIRAILLREMPRVIDLFRASKSRLYHSTHIDPPRPSVGPLCLCCRRHLCQLYPNYTPLITPN